MRRYEEGVEKLKDNRGRTRQAEEMTEIDKLKAEMKIPKARNGQPETENTSTKNCRSKKAADADGARQEYMYMAMAFSNEHRSLFRQCYESSLSYGLSRTEIRYPKETAQIQQVRT